MKGIFFDFDGVIQNTFEFHRRKIEEFTGMSLTPDDYRAIHRKNFFFKIPKRYKNVDWVKYTDFIYKDYVELKIDQNTKDYLSDFSKKYNLYIVSSGSSKNIFKYLENNQITNFFKEVLGFEFLKSKAEKFTYLFKKYGFVPSEGLFITDTLGDLEEANAVNLKTVAVDFGYHCRETLAEGNPLEIVSSFQELNNVIKKYD